MSDDGVVDLGKVREAFQNAKPRDGKPKREPKADTKKGGGTPPSPPSPPPPREFPPTRLPPDSPVKALGKDGRTLHFLAASGERVSLEAREINANTAMLLAGGEEYWVKLFPSYNKDGEKTGEFKRTKPVAALIGSACDMGLWRPEDKERGVGCWAEDDGTLVFHCGDILCTSQGRDKTGLRGRLLYPAAPRLPEPILRVPPSSGAEQAVAAWGPEQWAELDGPGARVMERFVTWNVARPLIDPILLLGLVACALLGAAPDWRPMGLLTGDSRTGKSTLLKGIKWLLGDGAFVSSGNATQAAIARKVLNSTRPVILDQMERSADNDRINKLIELMLLSSGGETLDRGTPGTETNTFQARNVFFIAAVSPPALRPEDLNRLLIVELGLLEGFVPSDQEEDEAEEGGQQVCPVWGHRQDVETIGRQMRGRLLGEWKRYHRTFQSYHKELLKQKHDSRTADVFGALLTAYDLVMFDGLDKTRAETFAAMLPAKRLAETSGQVSNHEQCLQHLLSFTPMTIRGGSNETIAHWLKQAREAVEMNQDNERNDAIRALAKTGIKLFREKDSAIGHNGKPKWLVALSHDCDGMAKVFAGTKWSKQAGSTAGWPIMFKRLPGAETHTKEGEKLRIRIDGWRHYVTYIPYDTLLPPLDEEADAAELNTVSLKDQDHTLVEEGERLV